MKLEVIGLALVRRRNAGIPVPSAQQMSIISAVQETPGLTVHQLQEIVDYSDRTNIERAIQGLIRKGYLKWELNPVTRGLKYFMTPEGRRWSSRSIAP